MDWVFTEAFRQTALSSWVVPPIVGVWLGVRAWVCFSLSVIKCNNNSIRVSTHQQIRVESNPVQSDSQRRGCDSVAYLQWQPRHCVRTSRVESSRVESSRVESSLVESSRVESHDSCRVNSLDAACSIFARLVIGHDGCCLEEEMDVEMLILLVRDLEAIYDVSRCEHRNCVLHRWWCS